MLELVSLSNLIAFGAIALFIIYWIHAFIILYHLIRFGVGPRPKQAAFVFLGGSLLLFIFLILAMLPVIYQN